MTPVSRIEGIAAPFGQPNVDTDVIMPKRFLKTVTRAGLADGVFADLRFQADGSEAPDFILNRPDYRGAPILVVGDNFGCGSSREHAVWGLAQLGVKVLLGTTFAGIFFDNCRRNGLLAITLDPTTRDALLARVSDCAQSHLAVDLPLQEIRASGLRVGFEIAPARKQDLLTGADPIAQTLTHAKAIRRFEAEAYAAAPWRRIAVG